MKKEGKIGLKKIVIQNLTQQVMERDEQEQARGGFVVTIEPAGITSMPIFCKP